MELTNQLEILKITYEVGDLDDFKKQYAFIKDNFPAESEVKQLDDFIEKMVEESITEGDLRMEEIRLRCNLILNKDIIPVSYIAKNYFNKDRNWLYQKINGNIKNGKPAKLSEEEIKIFNFALSDISRKIGSFAIHS